MTLDDLRTGDIVQLRNGAVYLVSAAHDNSDGGPYSFYSCDKGGNRFDIAEYNIDMLHGKYHNFDVMKVCTCSQPYHGSDWMFSLIRNGSKDISKKAIVIGWNWEREKDEELRAEKRKAFEECEKLQKTFDHINDRLNRLEKNEKIFRLIERIITEIDWDEWDIERILKGE